MVGWTRSQTEEAMRNTSGRQAILHPDATDQDKKLVQECRDQYKGQQPDQSSGPLAACEQLGIKDPSMLSEPKVPKAGGDVALMLVIAFAALALLFWIYGKAVRRSISNWLRSMKDRLTPTD